MRTSSTPLARQLVGAWELQSKPSNATERRTIEFHEDGNFWIYTGGKRDVETDTYRWRVSGGDLVVIFDDPLSQGAPAGRKIKELARRVRDPSNVARSYRYAVRDDGGGAISISLIEERGNPPAQMEGATLTREVQQPLP